MTTIRTLRTEIRQALRLAKQDVHAPTYLSAEQVECAVLARCTLPRDEVTPEDVRDALVAMVVLGEAIEGVRSSDGETVYRFLI